MTAPPTAAPSPIRTGCAPALEAAIRYAVGKGVFIAIAAGNSFEDGNPTQALSEIASRVQGAVSVAAVGVDTSHAAYSTTGSYVELAAPGGGGGTANNGYVWQQTFDPDFHGYFLAAAVELRATAVRRYGVCGLYRHIAWPRLTSRASPPC